MLVICNRCGKRFDHEMYSGLCPKCGSYHALTVEEQDIEQYINTEYDAEELHEQLHEDYDENLLKVHSEYEYYSGQERNGNGGTIAKVFLIFVMICIPFVFVASFQIWKSFMKSDMKLERLKTSEVNGFSVVFDEEEMESPVSIELKEAGMVYIPYMLPEGKSFVAVKALADSDDYSFDAVLGFVALEYSYEGNTYYRTPIEWYDLKTCRYELGLNEEDMLSTHRIGNGEEEEGYWFFAVEDDAVDMKLVLMINEGDYPEKMIAEAVISLKGLSKPAFATKEVQ